MFEHYTENAKNVMSRAKQEAQKMRHDHIGSEHILLGLLEVKEGVAADILSHKEIDIPHAKQQIDELVTHKPETEEMDYDSLPHTPHVQTVIDDALTEARQLKHNYIGTEHLLLGLLYENNGVGAHVLSNLGLKLDNVRADVLEFLKRDGYVNSHKNYGDVAN